jgi:hypothetical protein
MTKKAFRKKYEKVQRKEEEKKKKKEKNGEKLNKKDYFSPYLRRGHQSPNFFSITLMSDCLHFFPIYLSEGKKLSVYFPMMSSGGKILFCKKGITGIFTLLHRYFSITVCCLFIYIFSPLALFKVRY